MVAPPLLDVVETLRGRLTIAPIPTDPLAMILWENIGYLIDDERRRELYDAFAAGVGLDAAAIASAEDAVLAPLAKRGGMRPENRVWRWREIARIVLERCGGDLAGALRALPVTKARTLLKSFPAIGDPGADKILLLAGIAPRPALESNGLRTMARLGYFESGASYPANYRAGIAALVARGRADGAWLADAHRLLREHGRLICRRGEPLCMACPLEPVCPKAPAGSLAA